MKAVWGPHREAGWEREDGCLPREVTGETRPGAGSESGLTVTSGYVHTPLGPKDERNATTRLQGQELSSGELLSLIGGGGVTGPVTPPSIKGWEAQAAGPGMRLVYTVAGGHMPGQQESSQHSIKGPQGESSSHPLLPPSSSFLSSLLLTIE